MITLELTYAERDILSRAMTALTSSDYGDQVAIRTLARRISKLPCGDPNCDYCHNKMPIEGPPYVIGQYVVSLTVFPKARIRLWRVFTRAIWERADINHLSVFECTTKREALKHARMLERNRKDIMRAAHGDPGAQKRNHYLVQRVAREERVSDLLEAPDYTPLKDRP